MFIRSIFLASVFFLSLNAAPSVAQITQAVQANPALLNTPQAQAVMQEKGLSTTDVKQKLSESSTETSTETQKSDKIENDLDTTVEEFDKSDDDTLKADLEKSTIAKRIKPFDFKSDRQIRASLNKKQQTLIKKKLTRYSKRFYSNANKIDTASLPTPDDYIISNGDVLNIHIYGDRDQKSVFTVQSDGSIDLAFIGPVNIGGMKYKEAVDFLESQLQKHFQNSSFNISMNKYTSIQVTLIGEVNNPGIYNLSSFSTVKDLLVAAKGVNDNGSIRDIIVKRNNKVVANLDFYDLLFKGQNVGRTLLKHGDVIVIKKAETLVSIDGYVNSAAIFELKKGENLSKLIEYASGIKPDASKSNITVDRYSNNDKFETYKVSLAESQKFSIQNGDKIYVYPLDFTAKSSVSIYGNIVRPGSYRLDGEKTLNALLKESLAGGLKSFFLPQTFFEYGVIKRYSNDLVYKTLSFNLNDIIQNKKRLTLHPDDQIFIFHLNDIFANSYVTTKGETLLNPGKFQYIAGMTIQDAINASGIDGVIDDKVRVTTFTTKDFMPKTRFYSLSKEGCTVLNPYDELEVYDYYSVHALEPVYISGEVVNPTSVFYEKGMNLANLIRRAGGFNKRAYLKSAEIIRYYIDENQERQRKIITLDLEKQALNDIELHPFDRVKIFTIPNWNENRTVTIKGEVKFPGTYTVETGEELSSVLQRAGGFTSNAFIEAAVFTRESIKQNQIEQYNTSLAKIRRQLAIYNAMPANSKDAAASASASSTLNEVILEAKKYQPIGRLSIKLDSNLTKLENSEYNLVLQDKDTLVIPGKIDTISVFGEVFNPNSFVYSGKLDAEKYIELAGGYSRAADESNAYVIHADGTSEPIVNGWGMFSSNLDIVKGDTVVVPIYIKEYNQLDLWSSVAQVLSSFAITAAALQTVGVVN